MSCIGVGTGVVLVGLSELERSFGGAIVMSKVLAGIGSCLLYTSDAADDNASVDLGGLSLI
ncbi:MAG: hypothetical protein ACK52X_06005, partial [bacterium]